MSDFTLTGRTRVRSQHRLGREELVLQLEEKGFHIYNTGGCVSTEDVTRWRDARTTDLAMMLDPKWLSLAAFATTG
jgi:hypothetical protein